MSDNPNEGNQYDNANQEVVGTDIISGEGNESPETPETPEEPPVVEPEPEPEPEPEDE